MMTWQRAKAALLVFLAAGLLASAAHGADFLDFYKLGLAAAESEQWTQSAEMMRQAIAHQPDAKVKVKKSLFFRRYLPHFHLGRALFESGDCRAALESWRESESQGVVTRFSEYQQIQDGRTACSEMSDLEKALGEALQAVKMAETAGRQSRRRLAALLMTDATAKRLLDRQTEAEAELGRVSSRLVAGNVALGEVEDAARVAAGSRQEFEALEKLAKDHRGVQVARQHNEMTASVEPLIAAAQEELAASEYLRPYPTSVARSRVAVEQALEHARALEDSSLSKGEIEALSAELEVATEALRRTTSPPPAALTAAATAYLDKDYSGVLIALAEAEFSASKAAAHAHLLRAAAMFSLFQATGASDQALLEGARAEVVACQRADPQQIPPIAVFSPSFLAFFQEQASESFDSSPGEQSPESGI